MASVLPLLVGLLIVLLVRGFTPTYAPVLSMMTIVAVS